jgi:hypothetical protein
LQKIEIVQPLYNAVSGFKGCGIFLFNCNKISEHVFYPGTVHGHSKVAQAQVMSESQAAEASENTAPQTQGVRLTPSPVSTARRSFEDVSPVPSISQTKKRKTRQSQMLTDPKFIQKLKERPLP